MSLTIAWYSFEDPGYACARLRVLEPARTLGRAVRLIPAVVPDGPGHRVRPDLARTADLILIQRYFPCPQTGDLLDELFASGKPVVYDTDDDFTAIGPEHPFFPRMADVVPHILDTARRADLVTVSTPTLADVFARHNERVAVVPNLLPDSLWRPAPPPPRQAVAVLVAATPSHAADLAPLGPALAELARKRAGSLRFVFFGCPPPLPDFPAATVIDFADDYAAYAARLPRLGCAVALAPLADTPFNRAKSPIKWMEYAAAGAAAVLADLPPYRDVVAAGQTGLLAGQDPADWVRAILRLVDNRELRTELAASAMAAVTENHLLSRQAWRYLAAWNRAAGREAS